MNICKMRMEPFSDVEIARFRRLLANPKPGNPKWYKPPGVTPFKFRPGAPPVVPPQARCTVIRAPAHAELRCIGGPFDGENLAVCVENDVRTLPLTWRGQVGRYEGKKPGGTARYSDPLHWTIIEQAARVEKPAKVLPRPQARPRSPAKPQPVIWQFPTATIPKEYRSLRT